MNEKERLIISHLRKDARTSLASISQEIHIPISTIYDKINKLHKDNVIRKYTALVNFSSMGFHYHAKLVLKVKKEEKKELQLFLKKHQAVNSLSEINNGFDFLIETVHHDIKEFISFKEGLEECFNIIDLQEFQIIKEIERERFNSV